MVKAIIYTLAAIALCVGIFIFTEYYVTKQFGEFSSALDTLYSKIEDKTANREDGYAVRELWADKKAKLQIFLPHNDISYIDYWLSEACGLIYTEQYDLALGKIEVLKEITENLPSSYGLRIENIL